MFSHSLDKILFLSCMYDKTKSYVRISLEEKIKPISAQQTKVAAFFALSTTSRACSVILRVTQSLPILSKGSKLFSSSDSKNTNGYGF